MKLNVNSVGEKVVSTEDNITKMGFSEESQLLMFQLFSKNTYSNPIGSIVREITSNCFDSHKEAGVKRDVTLRINPASEVNNTPGSISFIDYGVGLSPERIDKVYKNYFSSTKRDGNDQIGGFGIGSKVPFSYSKVFYVTTIFDKIKYFYVMTMGEKGPDINLIDMEDTEDGNGTEVCVPFENSNDKYKFLSEIPNQLAYFENINFENCDDFKNDYKIYEGKYFLYKPNHSPYSGMHVVLGKVAYPLDFRTLGLNSNSYYCPIAIKFDIGELTVAMSRENLDYSVENISLIKERIKQAMDELAEKRQKQYSNITDFEFYLEARKNTSTIKIADSVYLTLPSAAMKDSFKVKFEELHKLGIEIPERIMFNKSVTMVSENRRDRNFFEKAEEVLGRKNVYILDCELDRNLVAYMREEVGDFYVIKNIQLEDLKRNSRGIYKSEEHLLNSLIEGHLYKYRRASDDESAAAFEIYKTFIDNWLLTKVKKLSEIVIPNDWFEERKAKRKENKEAKKEIVNIKLAFTNMWEEIDATTKDMEEAGVEIIYGFRDDRTMLEEVKNFLGSNYLSSPLKGATNPILKVSALPVVQVRKADEKAIQSVANAIHVSEFYTKIAPRFMEICKKVFVYNRLKSNGLINNRYSFNATLFGKEMFPKELETIKALKTLMNNGANLGMNRAMESIFNEKEADFIKEVEEKIEQLVKTEKLFEKRTQYFNCHHFDDKTFVDMFLPVVMKVN